MVFKKIRLFLLAAISMGIVLSYGGYFDFNVCLAKIRNLNKKKRKQGGSK